MLPYRILGAAFMGCALAACVGAIDDREGREQSDDVARPPEPGREGRVAAGGTAPAPAVTVPAGTRLTFSCTSPEKQGLGNGSLRRLTRVQLTNTLRDLLGADVIMDQEIQAALNRLGADAITADIAQFPAAPPADQPGVLAAIAVRAADLAAVPRKASQLFGACSQQVPVTEACATSFLTGFGQRALRRPLTAAEVTSHLGTWRNSGGGVGGLQAVLMRLLQGPAMVFHLELGKGTAGGRVRLTDHEVAARISYLVANTMPDAALFAAAAAGELQDLAKVRAHVERLLGAHPAAQEKLREFFGYYMDLVGTQAPFAPVAAARRIDPKGLEAEMVREALDFGVHHVLRKSGSTFRDLFTSTDAFPRSARMATILEAGVVSGDQPSQTNAQHAGILLRPALLASGLPRTPTMHRGKVVRQKLLCAELPAPPPDADAAIAMAPDPARFSNRAWLEMVTSPAQCRGCHAYVNPLGFVLEGYDQLGMPRTVETAYDALGKPGQSFPIDTRVTSLALDPDGPDTAAADATDLARGLAQSPTARACLARSAFEFYRLRETVEEADGCALRALEAAASDGGSLRALFVTNVANEDVFFRRAD